MDLAIIGFIIAVVGLILQLADAFPEHRETRKVVVLIAVGLFLGICASAILGAKYSITGDVDRRFVLLYSLAAIGGLFGILAYFTSDENRRNVALSFAVGTGFIFCLSGFAIGMGAMEREEQYSTDELLILADFAQQHHQYEIAIDRLKQLDRRIANQATSEKIKNRISKIEATQAGAK